MDKNALEAPCGVHCGLCPLHLAITDESVRNKIAERRKVPPEKVPCAGCRPMEGHSSSISGQCSTWLCAKEKGIAFCCECADFPCIKLAPCAHQAERRPHNIKVFSLAFRKTKGPHEWEKAIKDIYELYYRGQMAGHEPTHNGTKV